MTPQELRTLVDYHYWALDRLLAAVERLTPDQFTRDLGNSFPSVRDTLAHLQGAEWIWISRFHGETPSAGLPLDRFADVAAARAAWRDTERDLRALVERLDDDGTAQSLAYRLLNGTTGVSRVDETVLHLVNHGTYHRGQVTTLLRQLGAPAPASMDFIAFCRERDQGQRS